MGGFCYRFLHCDCITLVSEKKFIERYQKWCKRKGYNFSSVKASDVCASALGHITTLPKNDNTKILIQTASKELTAMNELLAVVRGDMIRLTKKLPEFETINAMYGVGQTTAAQLMAEIGGIRNFPRRSALVGFAGINSEVDDSRKKVSKSNPTTKRSSPHLRKTLFQIMTIHLHKQSQDEAAYQFQDKKSEPKQSRTGST